VPYLDRLPYLDRRVYLAAALVAAFAIAAFFIGRSRASSSSGAPLLTASAANVLFSYPASWHAPASEPRIPGLQINAGVALAPGGDAARAGLLAGRLPGGETGPLPKQFVALMRTLPSTEVVSLSEIQAYRYPRVSVLGFNGELTLYAIPNPGGEPTGLACYATAEVASNMRTCNQIVASLTLVGQAQGYDLSPEPAYASRVRAALGLLNTERAALRGKLASTAGSAPVAPLASRLARDFGSAAAAISALEPSLAARPAQTALTASILMAEQAYSTLAAAAGKQDQAQFDEARGAVEHAESEVDSALATFALLGYEQA
jgi:hypothetical protein